MAYKVPPIPRLFPTKCIYKESVILTGVYSLSNISRKTFSNKHDRHYATTNDKLRFGVGWDSPAVTTATTSSNVSYGSRVCNYAYYQGWKGDNETYKGEFSTTERFMSNPYFAAFVITATLFGAAIQYMRLESSIGWIRAAEERHHLKAAHYLAVARRESQLFGKRKKAEMMLDLLHANGVKDQNMCNSASILNS